MRQPLKSLSMTLLHPPLYDHSCNMQADTPGSNCKWQMLRLKEDLFERYLFRRSSSASLSPGELFRPAARNDSSGHAGKNRTDCGDFPSLQETRVKRLLSRDITQRRQTFTDQKEKLVQIVVKGSQWGRREQR